MVFVWWSYLVSSNGGLGGDLPYVLPLITAATILILNVVLLAIDL